MPENLWETKGIGGERGIWNLYIIMRMVKVMAMAMATVGGKRGLGKGGGGGIEGWFVVFVVFIFDIQNCYCKINRGGGKEDCFMLSYFVIVFWLSLFNAGLLISHQVQVNRWTVISCKIFLPVQIWSSHFCLAT